MQNSRAFYKSAKRNSRLTSLTEDLSGTDPPYREKLHNLFAQIESTFDALYAENLALQEKLEAVYAKQGVPDCTPANVQGQGDESLGTDTASSKSFKSKLASSGSKLKTSYKIKAQTSKIVSSFKAHSVVSTAVREYVGHKDGIWSVATKIGQPIIGTSSADHTACIWGIESGKCLLQYQGHNGSVNSIRFHPSQDLVLTGSGDGTAHVWQGFVNYDKSVKKSAHSSDDELTEAETEDERIDTLRTPVCELAGPGGHTSVVVAADWLPGGDQIVTASWDRTAILWNVETKEPIQTLTGHDGELTYCSVHPSQRLVVTVSRDSTFRLWDFRQEIPAVSVFQGHTESVTSAVLTKDDKVVSGSDDRSVKVWELKNIRAALTHIRTESAVNRLAVSANSVIAIPHDNRDVRLFDINGQRIARLSRTNRQGHSRMVSCVAWSEDPSAVVNLYSAGFDKKAIGWNVLLPKENN
ncbi:WD repeat-containing protein 37 [Culicoides brevitarsis]|uniref:WD repeat-containing protein 37 n=1 Tax=Culicoides brevitarsis TaxID=469753 RepID=UPI00307B5A92